MEEVEEEVEEVRDATVVQGSGVVAVAGIEVAGLVKATILRKSTSSTLYSSTTPPPRTSKSNKPK